MIRAQNSMLIDQILGNSMLAKFGYLSTDLRGRLSKAPKFMLRRDFAMAADALSESLDDINKALPFCRLPYPECWVEVAQGDRKSFVQSTIQPLETDSPVERIGFLLTQLGHEGSFSAQMFWSFPSSERMFGIPLPPSPASLMMKYDAGKAGVAEAVSLCKANGLNLDILSEMFPQAAMEDWAGEGGYLLAALALLNSRNASEVIAVDMTK
jgi:hypothetical protein